MTFSSLLEFCAGQLPGKTQEVARKEFAKRIDGSRLALRRPVGPIQQSGIQIVIGVATYSEPELALLDQLDASLHRGTDGKVRVEVFDVLECTQMDDFQKFIPGVNSVYRTPVVGVIADGKLVGQATGLADVKETLARFNILRD
jgi:hypothetical protein